MLSATKTLFTRRKQDFTNETVEEVRSKSKVISPVIVKRQKTDFTKKFLNKMQNIATGCNRKTSKNNVFLLK